MIKDLRDERKPGQPELELPLQTGHDPDQAAEHERQSLGELGARPVQRKASDGPSLRQQSLGELASLIQRREAGTVDQTADVQATAQAGVAGSGQALPHAARIQQAFGRHDVSDVRAHVGGEAAASSAALGARAYATGNQVAFAADPDLHTAAHEAAHTVQQRSGAVALKGLGPSGDVHEQHADAVADAVVAGRSAEPLLDQVAGAGAGAVGSDAVQRDELKKGEVTEADRDQVVLTNIVAGQNELDELLGYLGTTKTPDQAKVEHKIVRASLYLMEAQTTMVLGSKTNDKIAAAIASCNGAQTKVINAIFDHEALYQGTRDERERLEARVVDIMKRYGVEGGNELSKHKSTVGKGKDAKAPEVAALKASLHLAELEAARGFQALVGNTDPALRQGTITTTATLIYGHIGHATSMAWTDLDAAQLQALKPAVESMSSQILLIKRWMDGRQGNKGMVREFSNVVLATNGIREKVGLDAVDLDEAKGFPEREEAEEVVEKAQMDKAVGNFAEAWQRLYAAMEEGVEQWYELAKQGEQNKPSFGEQLLTALVTAAVGNIGGIIANGMFKVGKNQVIKAAIQELVSGVTSDASQSILNPAVAEAVSGSGTDPDLKSLLFVRGGLKTICRQTKTQHVTTLNEKVAAGKFSIAQVEGLELAAREAEKTAMADLKHLSATDWVRYVAQAGMGGKQLAGTGSVSNEVTNLDGYYGEYVPSGPRQAAYRRGNHEGNAGMLRVEVATYEHSITGPASGLLNIQKIDVNGLNADMAELLLSGKDVKTLDDVKVPKEIHVRYKVWKGRNTYHYPWLKIVVDEHGQIKGSLPEEDAPTDTSIWEQIRKVPISSDMAK